MIKPWLQAVLEGLVDEPELLIIEEKTDELGVLFSVTSPNKKDLSVLIGRKGEHVNAVRVLLRSYGHAHNIRASLKIITDV